MKFGGFYVTSCLLHHDTMTYVHPQGGVSRMCFIRGSIDVLWAQLHVAWIRWCEVRLLKLTFSLQWLEHHRSIFL